jgi:hypothetical protein
LAGRGRAVRVRSTVNRVTAACSTTIALQDSIRSALRGPKGIRHCLRERAIRGIRPAGDLTAALSETRGARGGRSVSPGGNMKFGEVIRAIWDTGERSGIRFDGTHYHQTVPNRTEVMRKQARVNALACFSFQR